MLRRKIPDALIFELLSFMSTVTYTHSPKTCSFLYKNLSGNSQPGMQWAILIRTLHLHTK